MARSDRLSDIHVFSNVFRTLGVQALVVIGMSTAWAAGTTVPVGRVILTDNVYMDVSLLQDGTWKRSLFTLMRDGQPVWRSPEVPSTFELEEDSNRQRMIRADLDGNGKDDWLYTYLGGWFNGTVAEIHSRTFDWRSESRPTEQDPPLRMCGLFSAWIVMDDLKTVYVLDYGVDDDPLAHGYSLGVNPKWLFNALNDKDRRHVLRSNVKLPDVVWRRIYKISKEKSCDVPSQRTGKLRPIEQQTRATPARETNFDRDWRDYLPAALDMYVRASAAYAERSPEQRKWGKGLDLFNCGRFFDAFRYNSVDPEKRFPEYTAMLNDFAYYKLMFDLESLERRRGQDPSEFQFAIDRLRYEVIPMLTHVIERDPNRAAAYLNLADAQWELPDQKEAARTTYRQYIEVLHKTKPKAKPAKQAMERAAKSL